MNEDILKTLLSSDFFAGGTLDPDKQDEFVRNVKDFAVMLREVRFVDMALTQVDIDKLHIGEPLTRPVAENENAFANLVKPKFNQVRLTATKVKTAYAITSETIQQNIEQEDIEATVMETVLKRVSTDFELAAIQGDTSVTPADPLTFLQSTLDGWNILSDNSHVVDVTGGQIAKEVFAEAVRAMPQNFLQDPDLRWYMSRVTNIDWLNLIADRATALGDAALQGNAQAPLGIPVTAVPLIPADLAVAITTATPASVISTEFGPYEITTGTNDKLQIDVDNAGVGTGVIITLPGGVLEVSRVAAEINSQLVAGGQTAIASDNGDGRLRLESTTTGAASEIDIQAEANDAYTEIGLTVAVTTGAASGNVNEGTFMFLTNPMNLIFGMLDGTRIFSEFEKDFDRIEVVIFNQIATQIENVDGLVKVKNLRRTPL